MAALRFFINTILWFVFIVFSAITFASEPPFEPILRIETGMHTALINRIDRIAIDSDERFLVTASYDKTIRAWDLKTGRLLNTKGRQMPVTAKPQTIPDFPVAVK